MSYILNDIIATQDVSKSLIVLDPQARSLDRLAPVSEENECVRGQVPVTARGGARTKSAINNTQTSGYVRA